MVTRYMCGDMQYIRTCLPTSLVRFQKWRSCLIRILATREHVRRIQRCEAHACPCIGDSASIDMTGKHSAACTWESNRLSDILDAVEYSLAAQSLSCVVIPELMACTSHAYLIRCLRRSIPTFIEGSCGFQYRWSNIYYSLIGQCFFASYMKLW